MRKINKTILVIFALVLSLSVTVGATVAYFSDYEQASGGATLYLGGKTEMTEGKDTGKKDIVITNTGKTDMIVRVGIYGPDGMDTPTMKAPWFKGKDGMYYYGKVLKGSDDPDQHPGENTGAGNLVASMSFHWEGEAPDYYFEVTAVHEGAQAIYYRDEDDGLIKLTVPDKWDADAVASIQFDPVQPPASN